MEQARLSRLILLFSILFSVLLLSPAFLSKQLFWDPLLKVGDITDIFTPIFLLPSYWLIFQVKSTLNLTTKQILLFIFFAGLFAQGQGMHLSANSIGHFIEHDNTPVGRLTYFFDEYLSHSIGI